MCVTSICTCTNTPENRIFTLFCKIVGAYTKSKPTKYEPRKCILVQKYAIQTMTDRHAHVAVHCGGTPGMRAAPRYRLEL
jgi:hypothetical protein